MNSTKTKIPMKIVINKCHGGFNLSALAVQKLAEREGRQCFFFTSGRTPDGRIDFNKRVSIGVEEADETFCWHAYDVPNPDAVFLKSDSDNWSAKPLEERQAINAKHASHTLDSRREDRTNPNLIAVVEELGEKASGHCAKLGIIEIPDGTDWQIEEYDGLEHVAQKHATWF